MIKIKSKYVPFWGLVAMTVYPFLFVKKDTCLTPKQERHEMIHAEQQKEMLLVFFYLWYLFEFVLRLIQYRNRNTAYKNISFEREAYCKESDITYLDKRKLFSWVKYIL